MAPKKKNQRAPGVTRLANIEVRITCLPIEECGTQREAERDEAFKRALGRLLLRLGRDGS